MLLDAANGKLEDYETVQTTHPIDQRKRRKLSKPSSTDDCDAANRMTIHAPLNINIHNARLLLRYLRIGKTKSNIELIPHSLIFTSLPFSTACKVSSNSKLTNIEPFRTFKEFKMSLEILLGAVPVGVTILKVQVAFLRSCFSLSGQIF